MLTRIEVYYKPNLQDPDGRRLIAEVATMGFESVNDIRSNDIYLIDGKLSDNDINKICQELLVDTVTQGYIINPGQKDRENREQDKKIIEISRKQGVMDPSEASILKGIIDMGLMVQSIKRTKRYIFPNSLQDDDCQLIANKILANPTIENAYFDEDAPPISSFKKPSEKSSSSFTVNVINVIGKSDTELIEISKNWQLSLNLLEMKTIQDHFTELGREPNDVELETIAQTWSEHCVHKTFKGVIEYNGNVIDDLLNATIVKSTRDINKEWCISVFKDNAGIIKFDEKLNICFKVETHNHPSAIEPYGGASTGIGGVIRDILGTGLGGRPILNTDVFCFGPPDLPQHKVPEGALHPKRIMHGVVNGVRDYGNRMGIPTLNGSIFFDKRYIGNPLVFCGTVGLIPVDMCEKEPEKGDLIILAGGRTGRDGIHGVTFASIGLDKESEADANCSVQIGNPITEKKLTEVLLKARDKGLYNCITDCGGGGLSSAIGEMGEDLGVEVYLDKVLLKYEGLSYAEIWISEAQERMIMAVKPENEEEIIKIFAEENVDASTIGRFTGEKKLHLVFREKTVGNIDMSFLHDGLPRFTRKAEWKPVQFDEPDLKGLERINISKDISDPVNKPLSTNRETAENFGENLKKILSSWNVCSKESIIREYDHEVQGCSILKPLQGVENDGPGDASIVAPVYGSNKGIIVSNGMNPRYGDIDPYHMAASAIDEALRQIIAVGGNIEHVALLDNFCWGNTERPECLGALVRAAQACHDYSIEYGTPFISGKDSLYNEFDNGSESISIPHSLLISAIGVMPDVTKAVSMDVKTPGNLIYIVGTTKCELGGSHYFLVNGYTGNEVPQVDAKLGKKVMNSLSDASSMGLIRSCHDCSEGGLAVAAAEMSFAGGYGMDLNIRNIPTDNKSMALGAFLFSESNSRFLVEIKPENQGLFEKTLKGVPFGFIGNVTNNDRFIIRDNNNNIIVSETIYTLKEQWQMPLR